MEKAAQADYIIDNNGNEENLRAQVEALWPRLQAESNKNPPNASLI
jgi:dephospho-CoA kinase